MTEDEFFADESPKHNNTFVVLAFIGILVILFGIFGMVANAVKLQRYERVNAVVVANERNYATKERNRRYRAIYEYYINDQRYTYTETFGSRRKLREGTSEQAWVDPLNPSKFCLHWYDMASTTAVFVGLIIAMFSLGFESMGNSRFSYEARQRLPVFCFGGIIFLVGIWVLIFVRMNFFDTLLPLMFALIGLFIMKISFNKIKGQVDVDKYLDEHLDAPIKGKSKQKNSDEEF